MIIFPAIDLRSGCCVRLRQGRPDQQTIFSEDPVEVARFWVSQGAAWLHIVDLDAALGVASPNRPLVAAIAHTVSVPIQFGGGLRSMEAIEAAFALGVSRVVIGTAAIHNPDLVAKAIARFGAEAVAVGIDSRHGKVTVHGWQETTTVDVIPLALQMKSLGVKRVIATDVSRDGMLSGPDLEMLRWLTEQSGLRVIASGGIATLADIQALATIPGIEGVIVGQALYQGVFTLSQAIAAINNHATTK